MRYRAPASASGGAGIECALMCLTLTRAPGICIPLPTLARTQAFCEKNGNGHQLNLEQAVYTKATTLLQPLAFLKAEETVLGHDSKCKLRLSQAE